MRARVARVHRSSGRRDGGSCGSRTTPTPKNDPKRARTRPSTRPEPRENRDLSRPFFIGYSMIPAGARWVVQNIYLTTTNCSSRSASSGFKTVSPLSHVHIHIIRIYILLGFLPDILTSFSSFYIYFFFYLSLFSTCLLSYSSIVSLLPIYIYRRNAAALISASLLRFSRTNQFFFYCLTSSRNEGPFLLSSPIPFLLLAVEKKKQTAGINGGFCARAEKIASNGTVCVLIMEDVRCY